MNSESIQQNNSEQQADCGTSSQNFGNTPVACCFVSNKVKIEMPKILGKINLPDSETKPIKRTRKNFFLPNDKCCYCDRSFSENLKPTKEHVIPRSKGGSNKLQNLKPCCIECNGLKSNYSIEEFRRFAKLLKRIMSKNLTYTIGDLENILKNLSSVK